MLLLSPKNQRHEKVFFAVTFLCCILLQIASVQSVKSSFDTGQNEQICFTAFVKHRSKQNT